MQERCVPLLGSIALEKLRHSHICIFGVGGVGGFVCEGLARMGVGEFTIVDYDTVCLSNVNRQIIALHSTLGRKKTEVMRERILDINPETAVHTVDCFVGKDTIELFDFRKFTYVIDCVDNVTAKLCIIAKAKQYDVPVISSMGTGNKLNPLLFRIADISKTSVCPLARVIRLELRKRGIQNVKVLFSTEEPIKGSAFVASVSFVPSVAGLLIAGEVVRDIAASTVSLYDTKDHTL